ncbi:hypothetical protein ACZ90_12705 [Streptomyces albus subsp. albus]|nr:hypothetical protein ACZ90_12705 [Streptomyces albus subsp. albus]
MLRTDADRLRRLRLASASALAPPPVILYVTTAGRADHHLRLARLRRYAAARNWDVRAEIISRAPLTLPMGRRPEWPRIERMITKGYAQGIVTPDLNDVRHVDSYLTLRGWLDHHGAWLDITEPTR